MNFLPYSPLILDRPLLEDLRSETYRSFVNTNCLAAGVRLVLQRHKLRPDWPYVDTKFNPNTGVDLPEGCYDVIYPWFLGRGMEALTLHLEALETIDLSEAERKNAREVFPLLINNMAADIVGLFERYDGRCPFRVDRSLRLLSEDAMPFPDPALAGPGDLFCAKGLILSERPSHREIAAGMLERIASRVANGAVQLEGGKTPARGMSQAMRMLFQSVPRLVAGRIGCESFRDRIFDRSCEFLEFVLDHHYDPATGLFSESIDPQTGERGDLLDPGHCAEFVGLGFSAIAAMEHDGPGMTDVRRALFARAKVEMPAILLGAMKLGFDERHGGIFKAVDIGKGRILNDEMPWWSLPETMRAAFHAAVATADPVLARSCLDVYAKCHNAYFRHYLNRDLSLFPYQTRSGKTGRVMDVAPAIPEGDPLYHSNLSFLDVMAKIPLGSSR